MLCKRCGGGTLAGGSGCGQEDEELWEFAIEEDKFREQEEGKEEDKGGGRKEAGGRALEYGIGRCPFEFDSRG